MNRRPVPPPADEGERYSMFRPRGNRPKPAEGWSDQEVERPRWFPAGDGSEHDPAAERRELPEPARHPDHVVDVAPDPRESWWGDERERSADLDVGVAASTPSGGVERADVGG